MTTVLGQAGPSDKFEKVRAYVDAWLSKASADTLLIPSSDVKERILDDWGNQQDKYQIVSVRDPGDYDTAGHIPNAMNIYWVDILKQENLARLDSTKTLIVYCYYGHASMLSSTILSLLGYRCQSLSYGMMGWNLDALVKKPWDQEADYEVEKAANPAKESHRLPVIPSTQDDARSLIKEMAGKYISSEGSPVISSADVKAIIDDWAHKKVEYQIIDVRSKKGYKAGHVPHAIHIPWTRIAETKNLTRLDPNKTAIVCSRNGQMGQLATTVLNLLGYRAVDMKFGIMDWNKAYVPVSEQWQGAATYPIERSPQNPAPR